MKIQKFDQNRQSEKIDFRTVKVAENLHTTSSRYSGWFPCFKSRGIGPPLYRNQKVTKYKGYADFFCTYDNFSAISMKIGRLYARKICAKCVKTRKQFVRSVLTLPWSCLPQKMGLRERSTCADLDQKSAKFMICQQNPRSGDP